MKAINGGCKVITVDVTDERLQLATESDADRVVDGRSNVGDEIKKLTRGEGA